MDHEPTPKQCEEAADRALEAIRDVLDAEGIDGRYLSKKLKRELNAKKTETFKGEVLIPKDPKDPNSELIKVGSVIYSAPMINWEVRQKARQDAHKLRGDYPPDKHELTGAEGGPVIIEVVYDTNGNGKKDQGSSTGSEDPPEAT